MARLILAPADRVSGIDFFRAVTGLPPMTDAEKAIRQARANERRRELREQHEREMAELRDRLCKQLSPESAAKLRAEWAAEEAAKRRDAA